MGFKNDDELTRYLKNVMKVATQKTQNDVYKIIENFMRQYYHEYDPLVYERTYSFFNSLVKSKIKKTGDYFSCYVEIDTSLMGDYFAHSGVEVMDMINRGFHADTNMNNGSTYETPRDIMGTSVWDESISEIEKTKIILRTFQEYFNKYAK